MAVAQHQVIHLNAHGSRQNNKMELEMNHGDGALAFWSGFFSAGSTGTLLLKVDWSALGMEISTKIFLAVVIAFLGGIAGVMGKDFYQAKIKKFITKANKNES